MIDAELFRVFHVVAQCTTISGAAKRLHVSQPAVSKSIRKLEDLTGCTLFWRSVKGVSLTTEGEILFDYVRRGFEHLQNGEQVLEEIRKKDQGLVRVGISNTLCRYFFLPHLETFHRRYPGIQIKVINRTSPQTLRLLEQGAIDFGIISIPTERSGFSFRELLTIQDIFVASPARAEVRGPLPLAAMAEYPLMMLEKDNVTRSCVDAYLEAQGVILEPEIEIGSLDFLIEFAKIGLGVALVIRNFVRTELEQGHLVEIPVTPAMGPRKIGVVMPHNRPLSIAAGTFVASLLDACSGSGEAPARRGS